MSIDRICCIIDFDGFSFKNYENGTTCKNEFLIREIGFVRIDPSFGNFLSKSFRFDLTFYDFNHSKDAWQTINYQSRYITGLSFKPVQSEPVYNYSHRFSCIQSIYKMCRQPGLDVVAFKAGIWEKKLLDELNIPWIDLEHYGCFNYEELVKRKMVFSNLNDCGYHNRISSSVDVVHCPMAEVTAFRDWLLFQYPAGIQRTSLCGSTKEFLPQSSSADSCSDLSSSSDCN